jgi:hypothetical protein
LEVVFSDHILAGLFGLCSIKGAGPTFNRTKELEVVFQIIFWAFSGSGRRYQWSYFNRTMSRLFFQIIFGRPFGLCSIKGNRSLLSKAKGSWRLFFRIISLQAFFGSAALKAPVPSTEPRELRLFFRSYLAGLSLCSIKGYRSHF